MKYAFIGTWVMSLEAIKLNLKLLESKNDSGNAICNAITNIEDCPYFKSVGFGGLPNENCEVELDAGFMNGTTFEVGAIAGVKNVKNPILLAHKLSQEKFNSFLVGEGAEQFAKNNGFEIANMLSNRAKTFYFKKIKTLKENPNLSPYDGHDTVGMVSLDAGSNIMVGTSTSGLFMKKSGRVGDSPIPGSGFYAESGVGGATATGLGEDIFKGCLSYRVVQALKNKKNIKTVVQKIVKEFSERLTKKFGKCGAISIVALDKDGNYGVGTNCDFSFVYGSKEEPTKVFLAKPNKNLTNLTICEPSNEWLNDYYKIKKEEII